MPELTVVLMDETDREQLQVVLRNPDDVDMTWLKGFIDRYDRTRTYAAKERVRSLFACDPDESGGYLEADPKHESFHSRRADLWGQQRQDDAMTGDERRTQILRYLIGHDYRPWPSTVREIGAAVGLSSPSTVHHHLRVLESEGLVEHGRMGFRARREP